MVFDGHAAYGCADAGCVSRTVLDPREMRFGGYLAGFGSFSPSDFRLPRSTIWAYDMMMALAYEVVKVSPDGLHPLEIWIDQSTHYVSHLVFADGRMRTNLSDYRQVGDVRVPFASEENGTTTRTLSVEFDPAGAETEASRRRSRAKARPTREHA